MALDVLADIDKETVGFVSTFDNQGVEPSVLPGRLPQLLLNGSSGIAVGMATNIPPHNLNEIADAIVALIDDPGASDDDICDIVKGPDFPTGGDDPRPRGDPRSLQDGPGFDRDSRQGRDRRRARQA